MKVKKLIKILQKEDPDKIVVISGYEGGCKDVNHISKIKLKLNVHTDWCYGEHEQDDDGDVDAIKIE